jgi:hypothetical protein
VTSCSSCWPPTPASRPLDALLVKTRELHEPLKARLEQGRDRLLEIHSSGGAAAQQLVDKLAAEDDDTGMISFASRCSTRSASIRMIEAKMRWC